MPGYLIVHKWRLATNFHGTIVYHDSFSGNQDPYIWSDPFIYSFCKTYWLSTTTRPISRGDYLFFLTAPSVANGLNSINGSIYCDLVFKVNETINWQSCHFNFSWASRTVLHQWNKRQKDDAFDDHFYWPSIGQHCWKKRRLITYVADATDSFQPQVSRNPLIIRGTNNLYDISNVLRRYNIVNLRLLPPTLINQNVVNALLNDINQNCNLFLRGRQLRNIRINHSWMNSRNKQGRPKNLKII